MIDDDPAVRSVLCDLLRALDYVVDEAAGGPEGLALFHVRLGCSGGGAIRARHPPVMLVTGSATDLDVHRAGALGLALLHKPVSLQELRTAVRQALAGSGPGRVAD